ncbi:hypothetical protein Leryth_010496 [Lithospermum erythrorhizon]|nr:hypothetical protein Leryth_010496 [Lithospermum erythrorhizon]
MLLSSLNLHPPRHHHHHLRLRNRNHHHSFATTSLTRLPSFKALTISSLNHRSNSAATLSPPLEFLRHLSISSVFLLGVTLYAFSSASAVGPPISAAQQQKIQQEEETQDADAVTDEELLEAFEKWKSKSYALTVPIRVVTYRNSFPPVWIKHFLQSQGKRAKLKVDMRQSLHSIFDELSLPFTSGKISPKSALAADVVSLGDSWINFAISKGLIEPMLGIEEEEWFKNLHENWKVYLRRSSNGKLDPQGKIWAVPYRWGSMVIAYKKSEFAKRKLDPIEDWEDLWRPELAGKIAMVDSSREVIGVVLKSMGASYNTENIGTQVSGGRDAVRQKLVQLARQVLLFYGNRVKWLLTGSLI